MIVACISSGVERAAIVHAAGDMRVRFCADAHHTAEAAGTAAVVAVVVEPRGESEAEIKAVARALDQRPRQVPLLLRFDSRRPTMRLVLEYVHHVQDLHLSLRGFDDLSESVASLKAQALEHTAREAIIARLLPMVPPAVRQIVGCAAIRSERRCTVSELAGLCDMSTRTMEGRLAEARIMGAKKLLMRLLALHTLWREEVLGWPPKRAAKAAGFPSPDVLARRIQRATGQRPPELLVSQSFSDALEDLAAGLRHTR